MKYVGIRNIYKFQHFKANNCMVCAFRPLFNISFFILPIEAYCKHSTSKYSIKPYFTVSPTFDILTHLLNFSMGILYLYYYYVVIGLSQTTHEFLLSVIDLIFIEMTIILIATLKFNLNTGLKCLNGWSQVIEHRIYYGIPVLLTSKQCREFASHTKISQLSFGLSVTTLLITYTIYGVHKELDVIKYLISIYCFNALFLLVLQIAQLSKLLLNMRRLIELQIVKNLEWRRKCYSMEKLLSKCTRLLLAKKSTFKYFIEYTNLAVFIILLMSITLMVLSIFLMVTQIVENGTEVYFLETRQLMIMLWIYYVVIRIEGQESVRIF